MRQNRNQVPPLKSHCLSILRDLLKDDEKVLKEKNQWQGVLTQRRVDVNQLPQNCKCAGADNN
jgi:hypothetical protein